MKLVDIFNVKKVKQLNEMLETYKKRIDSKDCTINKLVDEKNKLFDRLNLVNSEKDKTISDLKKKIESLERERDFLYQYYELDKEPPQEIKTKVRIDKRVRELEMENITLKSRIEAIGSSRIQEIQTRMLQPQNYSQNTLPFYNIYQVPYIR